jgi:serine/threonine protein kinase
VAHMVGDYPSTLNGRYHLLGVIGSGGMGVVWRAHDEVLNRQVACKILSDSIAEDSVIEKRFRREARHIASLSHPNIVTVFDSGTEGDFAYIVMEYVRGVSLRHVLGSMGVLPLDATAALAVDVLSALGHAHLRGIVHRDVKPANLLLEAGGTVKVADFGIAKSLSDVTELTADGAFVGTSAYASPEQLAGESLGPTSDLYSLACVLFQCLSGEPPYPTKDPGHLRMQQRFGDPPSLSDLRADAPPEIARAISHALSKAPADRFPDAAEMRKAFLPFASQESLRLLTRSDVLDSDIDTEASGIRESVRSRQVTATRIHQRVAPPSTRMKSRMSRNWILPSAIAGVLLVSAVVIALIVFSGGGVPSTASTIASGGYLQPGHSIRSANDRFSLNMQTDGNLVEYSEQGRVVQWETDTSGNFGAYLVMQADGNLVVYPSGKTAPAPGQPTPALWDSGTEGHPGSYAALLNDGALEVRAFRNVRLLWTSPSSHS